MRLLNDVRNYPALSRESKAQVAVFLTALSAVLSVLDSFIPKPLPMLKLGLANLVTVVLAMEDRPALGFETAFFRTLIAALALGTAFSFSHALSLSGAIFSFAASWLVVKALKDRVSAIGASVAGAFASVAAQGTVVLLFFGYDRGTMLLLSYFVWFGLAMGIVVGLMVKVFYRAAEKTTVN